MLELCALRETPTHHHRDAFDLPRRFEVRYPSSAAQLPDMMQGYGRNRESADAILTFLAQHFPINPAMYAAVRALIPHSA